ncbi:DUF4400 domain-containing protein [Hydrocarboniclastica marina]|uniref:DUF4400 domain-containing protein n=1 Tax=Hydrocarboniclastica marina TaxID=2259620 RepID=A0A4P7XLS3_9ALTE|nr:DUF4400 domain-containing protein [Hydrocarboniclastica marina]QCF28131.1 DUF4400 domain-containing protein [Hydrocarboniclastica marina]
MSRGFFVVLVVTIELMLIATLIPGDWAQQAIEKEAAYIANSSGLEHRDFILGKATGWYTSATIETGMWQAVYDFLIPTEQQRAESAIQADWWFSFLEGRIESLQKSVYHTMTRFALLLSWLPYILIILLPAAWDGLMTWKIKKTNFDYSSPVIHRYSIKAGATIVAVVLLAFFAPVPIDPIYIPAALMIIAIIAGIAIGNLQKRI